MSRAAAPGCFTKTFKISKKSCNEAALIRQYYVATLKSDPIHPIRGEP